MFKINNIWNESYLSFQETTKNKVTLSTFLTKTKTNLALVKYTRNLSVYGKMFKYLKAWDDLCTNIVLLSYRQITIFYFVLSIWPKITSKQMHQNKCIKYKWLYFMNIRVPIVAPTTQQVLLRISLKKSPSKRIRPIELFLYAWCFTYIAPLLLTIAKLLFRISNCMVT